MLLLRLCCLPVYSQVGHEATNSILEKFQKYSNNNVLEKTYLQFDKPYYSIGDTIYFKGYLTIGGSHKLSALSGVLHAELINPEGKIVRAENLQVTAGTSWGDFALADTLKGGTYVVRAYTNWMRNEGENSFF